MQQVPHAWRDQQEGATATEYLFLMVLIAIVVVGGIRFYGTGLETRFSSAGSGVANAS